MIFRLLILMDSFLLFFSTMHPDEFAQALYKLKVPFPFAFTISLAARFIPTLAEEARKIQETQMSRGIDFEGGNIISKVKNYVPLLVPLFVSAIRKAHLVAESIDSRGFNSHATRTFLHEIKFRKKDYFLLTIYVFLLLFCILFYFQIVNGIPTITQIISLFIR